MNHLLDGYTIQLDSISQHSKGYIRVVNGYCKNKRLPLSGDSKLETKATKILKDQVIFEENSDRREPLYDNLSAHMMKLSEGP